MVLSKAESLFAHLETEALLLVISEACHNLQWPSIPPRKSTSSFRNHVMSQEVLENPRQDCFVPAFLVAGVFILCLFLVVVRGGCWDQLPWEADKNFTLGEAFHSVIWP